MLHRPTDIDDDVSNHIVNSELVDQHMALLLASNGVEALGQDVELYNKLFASQPLRQVHALVERYDFYAQPRRMSNETPTSSTAGSNALNNSIDAVRGRGFEVELRRSAKLPSAVRHLLIVHGWFTEQFEDNKTDNSFYCS